MRVLVPQSLERVLDAFRRERGIEVEHPEEVIDAVAVRLAHRAILDHLVDDAAEVVASVDVPVLEDGAGKEAESADGMVAQPEAELSTVDVAILVVPELADG